MQRIVKEIRLVLNINHFSLNLRATNGQREHLTLFTEEVAGI